MRGLLILARCRGPDFACGLLHGSVALFSEQWIQERLDVSRAKGRQLDHGDGQPTKQDFAVVE